MKYTEFFLSCLLVVGAQIMAKESDVALSEPEVLFEAAQKGDAQKVRTILGKNKSLVTKRSKKDHKTVLHYACESGQAEVLKIVLEYPEVKVNGKDKNNKTALFYSKQAALFKLLVEHKAIDYNEALVQACYHGYTDIVQDLLKRSDINVNDSDDQDQTPLILSCKHNHIEIVKLLLQRADIQINKSDKKGQTALLAACQSNSVEIVKLLLKQTDIEVNEYNKKGQTALMVACISYFTQLFDLLLEDERIDVNSVDSYGNTTFMWACRCGYTDMVTKLARHEEVDVCLGQVYIGSPKARKAAAIIGGVAAAAALTGAIVKCAKN